MTLLELEKRLDEIAWHEQVESELRERAAGSHPPPSEIEAELRALASHVDPSMLDALEKEEGYLVWTLRLAPFVEHARAGERAKRYIDSPNWHVRHWARAVVQASS
jgi:hypothetical protein